MPTGQNRNNIKQPTAPQFHLVLLGTVGHIQMLDVFQKLQSIKLLCFCVCSENYDFLSEQNSVQRYECSAQYKMFVIVGAAAQQDCFVVVVVVVEDCRGDLKLLTAPDAYTAIGSCCLFSSIICIDGYSLSAFLTGFSARTALTNHCSVLPLYQILQRFFCFLHLPPSLCLSQTYTYSHLLKGANSISIFIQSKAKRGDKSFNERNKVHLY